MRILATSALLVSFALWSPLAMAQGPSDAALKLGDEGTELYRAHDYRQALEKFVAAYAIDPDPNLLYNQARCYEALGDKPAAIQKHKEFLARPGGDVAARAKAQATVERLTEELNHPVKPVEPAPGPQPAKPAPGGPANANDRPSPPAPATSSDGPALTAPAIVSFSLAVGLTGGAVVTGLMTLSASNKLADARYANPANGGSSSEVDAQSKKVTTLAIVTDILGATAIVAAGFGVYFTLAGKSDKPKAALRLTPGGVVLGGTFQ